MTETIVLNRYAIAINDYISKMNEDNESLEIVINAILAQLGGQVMGALAVPSGLQQIFDRRGLIGIGSYSFANGAGASFSVAAGGYWSGTQLFFKTSATTLSMTGKAAGTYYLNLDAAGNPSVSSSPDNTTSWQFSWDGTTNISNKALFAGVAVLFSGSDFATCLISAARSRTYQSLAARLEDIETGAFGPIQTITPGDAVTIDWSKSRKASLLLNRATTAISMANAPDGLACILFLVQDATGGRAVTFTSEVAAGSDLTLPPVLSDGANKEDIMGFLFRSSNNKYCYVSFIKGF